jgi:DNA repair protein SbcC/Rad50
VIKSLELRNFESHRHSRFEFSSGVNVLIGNSDSGKTAVLRALRWLSTNRPLGNDIVSWEGVSDGKETSATMVTDTDTIVRSKGKQEKHILNDLEFHAFKTDVPQEIEQAINMDSTNSKSQFESHFLLSKTPGEVAAFFNKIARLDKIDLSLSNINKWTLKIKSDIEYKNTDIETNKAKLLTYDYLTDFEVEIADLENDKLVLDALQIKRESLSKLIIKAEDIEISLTEEKEKLKIETQLNSILADMAEREAIASKADKLDSLIQEAEQVQQDIDKYTNILSLEQPVLDLLKLYADKKTAEAERTRLSMLIRNADNVGALLKASEERYTRLHQQFEDEFPSICPLCNKPK